jgi:hypothetical protein
MTGAIVGGGALSMCWMPTAIGAQFRPHLTMVPLVVAEAVAAQRSGAV